MHIFFANKLQRTVELVLVRIRLGDLIIHIQLKPNRIIFDSTVLRFKAVLSFLIFSMPRKNNFLGVPVFW